MYTDFASVYDHFMRDVDYPEWAARYASMLKKSAVRITECACGTGSITLEMKKLGYDITGADLSEEMLALAMARARQAGLNIPFILQDMRALTVPAELEFMKVSSYGAAAKTSGEIKINLDLNRDDLEDAIVELAEIIGG